MSDATLGLLAVAVVLLLLGAAVAYDLLAPPRRRRNAVDETRLRRVRRDAERRIGESSR